MQLVRYNLILLIALAGCSKEEKRAKIETPVPVLVERVLRQMVPLHVETIGRVESLTIIDIRPQVGGTLLDVHVEPGQIVKKGDLLFTIDPRSYQAAYEKAEANLLKDKAAFDFAKSRVERFNDLVKKEFISKLSFEEYKREMESAKAQVMNDEAELALAKIELEHCRICAPISGRLSNIRVDPGNLVMPGHDTPLTELRQISPVGIDFTVTQKDLQHMQRTKCAKDLKLEVILPHERWDRDDTYLGHLTFIDNHIDPSTGTILLQGLVDNEENLLWPGEFVNIRMCLRENENALLVPESGVLNGQQGPFLFVVNEDMSVAAKPVILGEKVGNNYIVAQGLEEGEKIVTRGHANLSAGKKVVIKQ